jgi:hypothetical protein
MRFIILALVLSSCSASFHLKQAERHLKKAEIKGAKIDADTVYKEILIYMPPQDSAIKVVTVLDTAQFDKVMARYDSLVKSTSTLISKEDLISARREISKLKGRIIKGFSKDSTYHYQVDSLTSLHIAIRGGVVDTVRLIRKEIVINHKVPVTVNKTISNTGKSGVELWLWLISAACIGAVLSKILWR